jgi:hypothetical protein
VSESTAELAVHLASAAQGADAGALVDSREFMGKVAALGPDSVGFVQRVQQAVAQAVQADPALRLGAAPAPAPAAGRVPEPGAAPEQRQEPPLSGTARLTYQASRRASLTADRAVEQITTDDVTDADPQVVNAWARAGKLTKFGVAVKQPRRG